MSDSGSQDLPDRGVLGDILGVALRAGQLLVENGANTSRVEDAVARLGMALGAQRFDVYVTPSGIIATAVAHGEHRTRIVRVLRTGIDLRRVAQVVALTDRLSKETLTVEQVRDELERVAHSPRLFGPLLTVPAIGFACAAFALLFGTSMQGAIAAGVAAGLGQALREGLSRIVPARLLITVIVAFVTSTLALFGALLLAPEDAGLAIAASVLLLVPGVLMVSSVGDLFRGDTISGVARATNAGLVILAMGAGVSLTLVLFHLPLVPGPETLQAPLISVALAFIATVGFALLFDVPVRALTLVPVVGALGYAVKAFTLHHGLGPEASVFLAGVTLSLLAEVAGRALDFPSNIFTIPAFIPLVPGVAAFRSVLYFAGRDYQSGTAALVQTVLWVGSLAAGVGTVQAVVSRTRTRFA